jgi:hypothetical protein
MILKKKKDIIFIILTVMLFFISGLINKNIKLPKIDISKQQSALNINDKFMQITSAGQQRLLCDLFWITTLLESDTDHYSRQDLNSWLYLRFKTIISLDPFFLENYQLGGKYLSIVKDDLLGAKEIFDSGLKQYPRDYDLLINAAFLYAFELNDFKMGYKLYEKVSHFPKAPKLLKTLLPKIQYQAGAKPQLIFSNLQEMLKREKSSFLKEKITKELYAIKAQIDLECLNKQKKNCSYKDYFGNFYIKKGALYKAPIKFNQYKLNLKN